MKLKNQKGIAGITLMLIIAGVLLLFGLGGGLLTAYKISSTLSSIPKLVWIGLIILVLFLLFKKK